MTKSRLEILKTRRAFLIEILGEARLQLEGDLEALELWVQELTKAIEIMTSGVDSLRKTTKDLSTKNRRWFKQ